MLLAGGQGSRLAPLTKNTAKPAVPFGGKYRIIDFSLSNCANSGIDTVGVLTQYQPLELNDYLGRGDPWDMNLKYGGLHVLPPYLALCAAGTDVALVSAGLAEAWAMLASALVGAGTCLVAYWRSWRLPVSADVERRRARRRRDA